MSDYAIDAHNLVKRYTTPSIWPFNKRSTTGPFALDHVSIQIQWGEIVALTGSNGAGKTTLLKILCTLIQPDAGQAIIAGHPLSSSSSPLTSNGAAIRQAIGLVVGDERSFYWRLSGRQNLKFFAALYGLHGKEGQQRIEDLLSKVNLHEVADSRFDRYSSGMKQRLSIARAMLHRPQILCLDEATRSLDSTERNRLHQYLFELNAKHNLTILMVTHDQQEASSISHRQIRLESGKRVE